MDFIYRGVEKNERQLPGLDGERGSIVTIDFDAHIRLADLRMKVLNHDYEPTPDEMRALILDLQRGREASAAREMAEKRKAKKASEPKPPVDLSELFGSLQ